MMPPGRCWRWWLCLPPPRVRLASSEPLLGPERRPCLAAVLVVVAFSWGAASTCCKRKKNEASHRRESKFFSLSTHTEFRRAFRSGGGEKKKSQSLSLSRGASLVFSASLQLLLLSSEAPCLVEASELCCPASFRKGRERKQGRRIPPTSPFSFAHSLFQPSTTPTKKL